MPAPAPLRVPAVASTAIREVLAGTARSGSVLGTSSHAIWILVDDQVVVATANGAPRLPNGVALAGDGFPSEFRSIGHGSPVRIGTGSIDVGGLSLGIVRWWDPRPSLAAVCLESVDDATADLPATVPGITADAIANALALRSAAMLADASARLIGKGPGLTPEADDYLCGVFSTIRVLGEAAGAWRSVEMLDAAAPAIISIASQRTTTFSAALVRHAIRGEVAAPAAALLRSFAGRGDVPGSHSAVLEIGHSSGPALAAGMVLGARSLIATHSLSEWRKP